MKHSTQVAARVPQDLTFWLSQQNGVIVGRVTKDY